MILHRAYGFERGPGWSEHRYHFTLVGEWWRVFERCDSQTVAARLDYFNTQPIIDDHDGEHHKFLQMGPFEDRHTPFEQDGEDMLRWLRENLKGKCRVTVRRSLSQGRDIDLSFTVRFSRASDAVAFRLCFSGEA